MKNLKKLNILLVLIFVSVAFMSFIPSTNSKSASNNSDKILLTPDPSSPNNLYVGWKEVNVDYRTSGDYYVLYSDIVSLSSGHTMTWGCGNLDLIPVTPEWDCSDVETYFSASGGEGCEYIFIHSNLPQNPNYPLVTHTIDIKVKDDQGDVSNAGGITLNIHYTPNPSNADPMDPCSNY